MHQVSVYIEHQGHELHIIGTFCPPEKSTWSEYDGGYPGCPAGIEDMTVFVCRGKKERAVCDPDGKIAAKLEGEALEALCANDLE